MINNIKDAFSTVLRVERARKNLSQEELALASNMDRRSMSNLETSKSMPKLATIIKIVKALDINLTDFMAELEKELKKKGVL